MSLFSKFKNKLNKTSNYLSFNILEILQSQKVDDVTLEELETVLISSDISLDVVNLLLESVKKVRSSSADTTKAVFESLASNIEKILQEREHVLIDTSKTNHKIITNK